MASQFLTAVGAFVGTFLGIWIAETSGTGNTDVSIKVGEGIFGTSVGAGEMVIPMTAGGALSRSHRTELMTRRVFVYRERQCHSGTVGGVEEWETGSQGGECIGLGSWSVLMESRQYAAMAFGVFCMVSLSAAESSSGLLRIYRLSLHGTSKRLTWEDVGGSYKSYKLHE